MRKPGAEAKGKMIGRCIAARFEALGAVFTAPFDSLAEVARLVVTPIQILLDGGFSKSSFSRIAKATGAIVARAVLRPIAVIGGVISPEVTFGVLHLSSALNKLGLIYRMQTASLGAFNKMEWANEVRSRATQLAFTRVEEARKSFHHSRIINEDTTSPRALTKEVFDKCVSGESTLDKKIEQWKNIVYSEIGSSDVRDPNRGGILLLEIGRKLLAVQEQPKIVTSYDEGLLLPAALFDFLRSAQNDRTKISYSDLGYACKDPQKYGEVAGAFEELAKLYKELIEKEKADLDGVFHGQKNSKDLDAKLQTKYKQFIKHTQTIKRLFDERQAELGANWKLEQLFNVITQEGKGGF